MHAYDWASDLHRGLVLKLTTSYLNTPQVPAIAQNYKNELYKAPS
jgi:hypothetical protein